MALKVVRASALRPPASTCLVCGKELIQYVPHCTSCHAPVPVEPNEPGDPLRSPDGMTRIAHLSDLHIPDPGSPQLGCLATWLGELRRCGTSVVAISGDLANRGDRGDVFKAARDVLVSSGLEWCVVPGNHDAPVPDELDRFGVTFGRYPRIEVHAGVQFLLVDSNAGIPPEERTFLERNILARCRKVNGCITEGRIGSEQLDRLGRLLESLPKGPRVLVLHHHLVPQAAERIVCVCEDVLGTMNVLQDAYAVRTWASRHGVALALYGHKHDMMHLGVLEGPLVALGGGSSTKEPSPFRARLVDMDSGRCRRVIEVALTM